MAGGEIIDVLLRGMNAGTLALLCIALLARRPPNLRQAFGAIFALGTAAYVLVSSPALVAAMGPLYLPMQALSLAAPVFFWWFSLVLFDDKFRWRLPLVIPLLLVAPVFATHHWGYRDTAAGAASILLLQATMLFVYGHAVMTALRFLEDDLLEGRRRFRIIFSIAVAFTGIVITAVESVVSPGTATLGLRLFQAAAILTLTLAFAAWLTATRAEVIEGAPRREQHVAFSGQDLTLSAPDRAVFGRLSRLMEEGAWREESLTIASLAQKVGVPEHQLRRLINGALGFRNFSAFLNDWRIAAAKSALADPGQARRQVLQIALDVGFGSIAPFNRAFKDATGKTPTEFRKEAMASATLKSEIP